MAVLRSVSEWRRPRNRITAIDARLFGLILLVVAFAVASSQNTSKNLMLLFGVIVVYLLTFLLWRPGETRKSVLNPSFPIAYRLLKLMKRLRKASAADHARKLTFPYGILDEVVILGAAAAEQGLVTRAAFPDIRSIDGHGRHVGAEGAKLLAEISEAILDMAEYRFDWSARRIWLVSEQGRKLLARNSRILHGVDFASTIFGAVAGAVLASALTKVRS